MWPRLVWTVESQLSECIGISKQILGYLKIIFYFSNGFYCNHFSPLLSPGKTTHKTQFKLPQLKSQKIKNFKTLRYTPVSNTDRYRPVCSKIEGVKKNFICWKLCYIKIFNVVTHFFHQKNCNLSKMDVINIDSLMFIINSIFLWETLVTNSTDSNVIYIWPCVQVSTSNQVRIHNFPLSSND